MLDQKLAQETIATATSCADQGGWKHPTLDPIEEADERLALGLGTEVRPPIKLSFSNRDDADTPGRPFKGVCKPLRPECCRTGPA